MPIFTGGNKTGIPDVTANKLIDKMIGYQTSFLPDDLKVKYMGLIEQRIKLLAKEK